jgi:hypothetical protein
MSTECQIFKIGFRKVQDDISGRAELVSASDLGFELDLTFELCHLNSQNSCR